MAKKTVLVTGASGNVGKAFLKVVGKYADYYQIKAGTRTPANHAELAGFAPNVTVVEADGASLATAFQGVDYGYLIMPGSLDRAEIVKVQVDAAKAAGVTYLLVISVSSAGNKSLLFGRQCGEIEAAVKASGIPYTILQLPFFFENLFGQIGSIKGQSSIYDSIKPDIAFPSVCLDDVAAVAAEILKDPSSHLNKTYNLCSPAASYNDVAAAFSAALGRPIAYVQVPYDGLKQALVSAGFPEWQAGGIVEMAVTINEGGEGYSLDGNAGADTIKSITGRPATTMEQFVKAIAPAFA